MTLNENIIDGFKLVDMNIKSLNESDKPGVWFTTKYKNHTLNAAYVANNPSTGISRDFKEMYHELDTNYILLKQMTLGVNHVGDGMYRTIVNVPLGGIMYTLAVNYKLGKMPEVVSEWNIDDVTFGFGKTYYPNKKVVLPLSNEEIMLLAKLVVRHFSLNSKYTMHLYKGLE